MALALVALASLMADTIPENATNDVATPSPVLVLPPVAVWREGDRHVELNCRSNVGAEELIWIFDDESDIPFVNESASLANRSDCIMASVVEDIHSSTLRLYANPLCPFHGLQGDIEGKCLTENGASQAFQVHLERRPEWMSQHWKRRLRRLANKRAVGFVLGMMPPLVVLLYLAFYVSCFRNAINASNMFGAEDA